MSLLDTLHGSYIHTRRVRILSELLQELLPTNCSVVDIGCGDGRLAKDVAEKRTDVTVAGADVLDRPSAVIPVREFDGLHLPWEDNSVDVAMFVDVLHHCDDPVALLRDAKRVARRAIVIKDHTVSGPFAWNRLSFMDKVGNARHGVALPCNYYSRQEWLDVFSQLDLHITSLSSDFQLYPQPLELLFGGNLHFMALLQAEEVSSEQ